MPVEILEITVRANIQEQGPGQAPAANGSSDHDSIQRQQLIEECVYQVLEILRHRAER
ncbi:MAG: DUF5908 family protein [Ferruginibacter sp.]